MDQLLDMLNQYLQAAHGALVKYGPNVWDSTLSLMRINGIFNLVMLLFWSVVISIVTIKILPMVYVKTHETFDDHPGWLLAAIVGTMGVVIGGVMVLIGWSTSLPFWLEAFNPQSAVLYQLAQKAGLL